MELLGYLFLASFLVAFGATLGYYSIGFLVNTALNKYNIHILKKAQEKARSRASTRSTPKTKLCLKCKYHPRQEGVMYCKKCRFDGIPGA